MAQKDEAPKWKVVRTAQFEEDLKRMSPEDQEEVEKAIENIAKDPYIGEPSKPCPECGKYFFHSDGECPWCGHVLDTASVKEVSP